MALYQTDSTRCTMTSRTLNVTSIWKRKLRTVTKQLNYWMIHLDRETNSCRHMNWKTNHLNLNLKVIRDSNIQTFEGQLQSCRPYRVSLSRNQDHATAVIKQCWHLDSDTLRGLSHVHINSQTELKADVILSHSLGTINTFCRHYPRPEILKRWVRWTWWPRVRPYLNQNTQISSNL
jgi:hypothetical protein